MGITAGSSTDAAEDLAVRAAVHPDMAGPALEKSADELEQA
ncbi:hypothetical protein [Dactylosporangium sp. NPDC005555]